MIRVAIIEDDTRIREAMVVLLEGSSGIRCVGAYENAEEGLTDIPLKQPDIVLMDINLPGMSGIKCTWLLKEECPLCRLLC